MKALLSREAQKQLDRLNDPTATRIEGLECEPPKGDIKPLKGSANTFRLRVGDYRILYAVENNHIKVFKIAPRSEAYRRKK